MLSLMNDFYHQCSHYLCNAKMILPNLWKTFIYDAPNLEDEGNCSLNDLMLSYRLH